ncbi:hypothetical protein [Streptomyces pseudovenezuelae]|uniref:hypothetical protein n=1 Tax=Streptomyces pseudovenezuelae TaxID=67350 RepID=UPI0036F117F7
MLTITYQGAEPGPVQPRRDDFPSHDAYLLAWYTWRSIRRDSRLTDAESAAKYDVVERHVRKLTGLTQQPLW